MLVVNECYPAIQGEGKSAGLPVVFLRLSGCNLACVWCDTPFTWNWNGTKFEHPDKYDKEKEVHKMSIYEAVNLIYEKCNGVRSLVISGGEPMLQQATLTLMLMDLRNANPNWWVEVETNGTIEPTDEFTALINQFNCSPKLSNAGRDNPRSKRLHFEAINKIEASRKGTFKFVIQSDSDLEEMREVLLLAKIEHYNVYLMPEGRTRDEQEKRQEQVKQLSKLHGYNFSPRLHILEFDSKRGV